MIDVFKRTLGFKSNSDCLDGSEHKCGAINSDVYEAVVGACLP